MPFTSVCTNPIRNDSLTNLDHWSYLTGRAIFDQVVLETSNLRNSYRFIITLKKRYDRGWNLGLLSPPVGSLLVH